MIAAVIGARHPRGDGQPGEGKFMIAAEGVSSGALAPARIRQHGVRRKQLFVIANYLSIKSSYKDLIKSGGQCWV